MDFRDFLPEEEESDLLIEEPKIEEKTEKIGQTQFYDIVTSQKPDWQAIIYELINAEQLDPWDIDIVLLTRRYFEKIIEIEEKAVAEGVEEIDFYISSKVLFAAALLLRIKSEILLDKHIKSIDEILFGRKEENKHLIERIEIDENELPLLIPKTPLPRLRKVTLNELMSALDKAINTESRRIKREVAIKRAKKLSEVDIPKFRRIDLKDRIKQFYAKILTSIKKIDKEDDNYNPEKLKLLNKVPYSNLVGKEREEKLACFLPLLHLNNSQRLWLEQKGHLDEIWIFLYEFFNKNRDKFIEELEEDIEEIKEAEENFESLDSEEINNPGLEKARLKREEKKKLEEEVREELIKELGEEVKKDIKEIKKEEKIEEISGFDDEM